VKNRGKSFIKGVTFSYFYWAIYTLNKTPPHLFCTGLFFTKRSTALTRSPKRGWLEPEKGGFSLKLERGDLVPDFDYKFKGIKATAGNY